MGRFVIQPHMRLQEWVAEEKDYFRAQGLDYEFDSSFASTSSLSGSVKSGEDVPQEVKSGAFEDMEQGRACDVSAACHWAVNAAATTHHGRMWGHAYSVCPSGIFVAPESSITRPEDLANAEIGVGYHSGSHYSAIQALEPFLGRDQIKLSFIGRPYDRVRALLSRSIPAANIFGPQFYLVEQHGFRRVVDTTFMMGFLLSADADLADTEKYFDALRLAQRDIDLEPERYKHYWLREMPDELHAGVDVRRFGPGERIVFEPYTRDMYERTHRWMESWELFDSSSVARPAYEDAVIA